MGNVQLTNMGQNFKLIVGLGNPGREYQATRHNIGASLLLQLASALNLRWQNESKFSAELAKTDGIILLRPTTYMNLSGQAVGAAAHFYRILPEEILVVHDELDLLPGEVRLKQGGGHAGHNGLRDIDSHLSSRNYWRLRLGIGHPKRLQIAQQVADYVLSSPRQQDALPLATVMDACVNAWPEIKAGDVAALQRRLHSLTAAEQASAAPN